MWLIRTLLAYLGICGYVNVAGKEGKIVGESKDKLHVRTFVHLSPTYGQFWVGWIWKNDSHLGKPYWGLNERLLGGFILETGITITIITLLFIGWTHLNLDWSSFQTPTSMVNNIDQTTGLPLMEDVFYPNHLPDGHYTLTKVLIHGEAKVVQHLPGPDRDFVYYVMNTKVVDDQQLPVGCKPGDRFQIFQGRPI